MTTTTVADLLIMHIGADVATRHLSQFLSCLDLERLGLPPRQDPCGNRLFEAAQREHFPCVLKENEDWWLQNTGHLPPSSSIHHINLSK